MAKTAINKSRLLLFWFSNPKRKTVSFSQRFSIGLRPMLIPSACLLCPSLRSKEWNVLISQSPVHPGAREGREGFSKDYQRAVTRGGGMEGCWAGTATDGHSICSHVSGGMDVQKSQQRQREVVVLVREGGPWNDKISRWWGGHWGGRRVLAGGGRKSRVWSRIAHMTGPLCTRELRLMRSRRPEDGRPWAYPSSRWQWRTFENEGRAGELVRG